MALGAEVHGYALLPEHNNSLSSLLNHEVRLEQSIAGDVRDREKLLKCVDTIQPDFVFHLAAQTIVQRGYQNPQETFDVNVNGTANLLDALRNVERRTNVVVVTSDKCYLNLEEKRAFIESDKLGGKDPYSASKAAQEIVAQSYRDSFFNNEVAAPVYVATARAGNVIGGGDWTDSALIPDLAEAMATAKPMCLRYPNAVRPWQHVLDCLNGYLTLAAHLDSEWGHEYADAWNFGPSNRDRFTVKELVEHFLTSAAVNLPIEAGEPDNHEATFLALDSGKAKAKLGWQTRLPMEETVRATALWYQQYFESQGCSVRMSDLTRGQIQSFQANHQTKITL